MNQFKFSIFNKIKFYSSYFFTKVFLLPFEVEFPRWKFYANELVYSFGKIIPFISKYKLPFEISELRTKYGNFLIRQGTLDQICASPAFEREDVNFLLKLISKFVLEKKKILFLDIGADFGSYSVAVGNKFKSYNDLDIVAFEPTKSSYKLLQENINKNNIKNVKTFNFGLFNKEMDIKLSFNLFSPGGSRIGNLVNDSSVEEIIYVKKLDDVSEINMNIYDVVIFKIDVEGVEKEVIEGSLRFISKQKQVYVMVEDFVNKEIIEFLNTSNFMFLYKFTSYNSWWTTK